MKLIHKSGSVRCNNSTISSKWDCTWPTYGENLLTIITDANKKAFLPNSENLLAHRREKVKYSYSLPEYRHNSTKLVFPNLVNPLSVSSNKEMQEWYGQDWRNCKEEDNSDKTYVDVYTWYARLCLLETISSLI